jgi:hypothetical protein
MLKISQINSGNHLLILRLEGRIAGPWVAEMKSACEKILGERTPLKLELADVIYADRDGVAALAGLQSRGVLLADCSSFLAEQLKAFP